ncbi:MAG: FapA family protein [Planctomycetota bacterium]
MSDHIDNAIRVGLDGTLMTATLRIAAGTDADHVNAMTVGSIATGRGVQSSEALEQAIAEAVNLYDPEAEGDFEHIIARGIAPTHGEDGRFELDDSILEVLDRAAQLKRRRPVERDESEPLEEIEGDSSHYQRSTIAVVLEGDRIGRIVEPTAGEDGTDVCGGCAPARHGGPAIISVDESTITRHEDGTLTAAVGGLLNTADNHLRITEDLVIPGYVDFSTGNVEFDGDITIEKGVRDCFVVTAARSLKVLGQVEAATLRAGRDVHLMRGITGREKGEIVAGRDLRSRFLDSSDLTVARDLHAEREITHCTINVGRNIIAPSAALLGGSCTVAGSAEFGQIGTESGTPTTLRLGKLPRIDSLISEAAELYPKLIERRATAREQLEQLQVNTAKLTASQAESMTELQFVVAEAESKLGPLRDSVASVINLMYIATEGALIVHRKILPETRLRLGGRQARIEREIPGPVRIELDDAGDPIVIDLNSGSRTPLSTYAAMDIDDSTIDFDDIKQQLGIAA